MVHKPAELLLRHGGRAHRVVRNGIPFRVDALNDRLLNTFRQVAAYARHRITHVAHRSINGRADFKRNEQHRGAFGRSRGDIANIADIGDSALHLLENLRLHFGWGRSRLRHHHRDHREGNVRIQLNRQLNKGRQTHEGQHPKQHHWKYRVLNGPSRNISHGVDFPRPITRTDSPSFKKAPAVATTRSSPVSPSRMATPPLCASP